MADGRNDAEDPRGNGAQQPGQQGQGQGFNYEPTQIAPAVQPPQPNPSRDPRAAGATPPPPPPPAAPPAPPAQQPPAQAPGGYGYPQAPGGYGQPQPGSAAPQPGPQAGYGYPHGAPTPQPGQNPPQQPPAQAPGGYGYPQAPGGYGQPQPGQTPQPGFPPPGGPGQPGYGFPQQPGGPGQPGYGFPPQGPGGPGGAYPPPYPGGPGLPGAPGGPGGGSGGRSRKTLYAVIGGVVALAVLVTGGIFLFGGDGDSASSKKNKADGGQSGKPNPAGRSGDVLPGNHRKLWSVKTKTDPHDSKDLSEMLVGSMITKDRVIRADKTGVDAYKYTGGAPSSKPDYTVNPHGADRVPCALSPKPNRDNIGAVVFKAGKKGDCRYLETFNASTGKTKLNYDLLGNKSDSGFSFDDMKVFVNDTKVVTASGGGAFGIDLKSGKQTWSFTDDDAGQDCTVSGGGGSGNQAVVWTSCFMSADNKHQVLLLNATKGSKEWTWDAPGKDPMIRLMNVNPVTVTVTKDLVSDKSEFYTFDSKGHPYPAIKSDNELGHLEDNFGAMESKDAARIFFHGTTMYLSANPQKHSQDNRFLVAFNLVTGKPKWQSDPRKSPSANVFAADDKGVLSIDASHDQAYKLARFGYSDGGISTGGRLSADDDDRMPTTSGPIYVRDGKIIIVPSSAAYGYRVAAWGAE